MAWSTPGSVVIRIERTIASFREEASKTQKSMLSLAEEGRRDGKVMRNMTILIGVLTLANVALTLVNVGVVVFPSLIQRINHFFT